jgi:hypothetical protein
MESTPDWTVIEGIDGINYYKKICEIEKQLHDMTCNQNKFYNDIMCKFTESFDKHVIQMGIISEIVSELVYIKGKLDDQTTKIDSQTTKIDSQTTKIDSQTTKIDSQTTNIDKISDILNSLANETKLLTKTISTMGTLTVQQDPQKNPPNTIVQDSPVFQNMFTSFNQKRNLNWALRNGTVQKFLPDNTNPL